MLTYADVCSGVDYFHYIPSGHVQWESPAAGTQFTAQFTCFTSTKSQILTPEELQSRRPHHLSPRFQALLLHSTEAYAAAVTVAAVWVMGR